MQKETLENAVFSRVFGGRNRTRTCDPIDVNDVLYQLSHATLSEHFWHFEEIVRVFPRGQCELFASKLFTSTTLVGYSYQQVLPTEPCDHIQFMICSLANNRYYIINQENCQGLRRYFFHHLVFASRGAAAGWSKRREKGPY